MRYFRQSPFILMFVLYLLSPQLSLAAEKCRLLGSPEPSNTTTKYRAVKCSYKIGRYRHRLTQWASAFCGNRGYQRAVTNTRFSKGAGAIARGTKAATKRFKVINGLCVPKGKFAQQQRTRNCVRNNLDVSCNFTLRKRRSELRKWARGMCSLINRKTQINTFKYHRCSRNGKRCKKITSSCSATQTIR